MVTGIFTVSFKDLVFIVVVESHIHCCHLLLLAIDVAFMC